MSVVMLFIVYWHWTRFTDTDYVLLILFTDAVYCLLYYCLLTMFIGFWQSVRLNVQHTAYWQCLRFTDTVHRLLTQFTAYWQCSRFTDTVYHLLTQVTVYWQLLRCIDSVNGLVPLFTDNANGLLTLFKSFWQCLLTIVLAY